MIGVVSRVGHYWKSSLYPLPSYIHRREQAAAFRPITAPPPCLETPPVQPKAEQQPPCKKEVQKTEDLISWYLRTGYRLTKDSSTPSASFGQKTPSSRTLSPGMTLLSLVGGAFFCTGKVLLGVSPLINTVSSAFLLALGSIRLHGKNASLLRDGAILHPSEVEKFQLYPSYAPCSALPTEHSTETMLWRHQLIRSAEHNIVISGNYCGGKEFLHLLSMIEERMKEKPDLKVVVISSPVCLKGSKPLGEATPQFLRGKERSVLATLTKVYPERFSFIESPDYFIGYEKEIKKSTNHTKCMVIDYGRYFILGGSGIKDNFTTPGLDNLSKEEYLGLKGKEQDKPHNALDFLLPRSWRDGDFVFGNEQFNESGKQVYRQALLLALKYEQRTKKGREVSIEELGMLSGTNTPIQEQDSVTVRLLKTPIPEAVQTWVSRFEESPEKSSHSAFKLVCVEPSMEKSPLSREILFEIDQATSEIEINHMYFHPTQEILKALARAAERGVKITIITNGPHMRSGPTVYGYGSRNRVSYHELVSMVSKEHRKHIHCFEFSQVSSALHKKVIVIDRQIVIGGSSNFGTKSLTSSSDEEMNFIVKNPPFARKVSLIHEEDMKHSKKVENPPSFLETVAAKIHKYFAWYWG